MNEPPAIGPILAVDAYGRVSNLSGVGGEDYRAWLNRRDRERAQPAPDPSRTYVLPDGKGRGGYDASDPEDRERARGLMHEAGATDWEPELV